jgi:D-tyrosyl-tRNA(Tyr) deacylase
VRRGNRPSFDGAMEPAGAERLYERFVAEARARGVPVATGRFRADMRVHVENDGPVTILIDSRKAF